MLLTFYDLAHLQKGKWKSVEEKLSNSFRWKWGDKIGDSGKCKHGRREIVLVSVTLLMSDIAVPVGS